jgi:acetylornithine deacetylase/succinyl-diaminopimelate desuccinylase-like protein
VPSHDALVAELAELIAIPSISADPAHADDVGRAAEWVRDAVIRAGGEAELVPWGERPLVVGEVRASRDAETAPTVLAYGHFDVQPPDPLELWETPPFELHERDGWLVARGVADDKGQLYMVLDAVKALAAAGELRVNVRVVCDGEEEVGGHSVVEWLDADGRGADAAVIFDSSYVARGVPAFNIAVRGLCYVHLTVRTGGRDLHSGLYGGAALNAMHALLRTLDGVTPRDGRLPEPLRAGVVPPSVEEAQGWERLPSGAAELDAAAARPADGAAAEQFYTRTWAEPSLDVHGIAGGSPILQKTVIPVEAQANLSIRLVGDQRPEEIVPALEHLLRESAPAGAEIEIDVLSQAPPGLVPADSPAVQLALDAFEHVLGVRPLLIRSGGAIPLVSALAGRGVPTVLTGFALNDSNIHSPNERLPVEHLSLGVDAACELFRRLGRLS